MFRLYFSIGKMVENEFAKNKWGAKVVDEISKRLQQEMPCLSGFSGKNIAKMRAFYNAWQTENVIFSSTKSKSEKNMPDIYSSTASKTQNPDITAFLSVSFTHHYEIILKPLTHEQRWHYIKQAAINSGQCVI
jgi:hypothetical protein